jgi:hypothetical protein
MSYQDIIKVVDQLARTNYSYEPFATANPQNDFVSDPTVGSHSDANILQAPPKTVGVKRYVIIDSSQRDWVKQPNPFSNLIFTFGAQSAKAANPPVYTNNPFVPTFAVDSNDTFNTTPGLRNTGGWYLPATPSNIFYPPYNSSLPQGSFIGYDTGYVIQPSGAGFGSVFTPCNVSEIRLVRAVLPQRQFLSLPIVPGNADSATIQALVANSAYSTFSTYPYLILYLNEYYGQYVGGNEPMRKSFSVMTQKQRTQTDFQIAVGVQQYDYEPWGSESLHLQSPITNLQRIQLSVTDPVGTPFVQNDTLQISLMQATADNLFINCFTPDRQYFLATELRVGDRISFHGPTLSNILNSSIFSVQNSDKKNFVTSLLTGTFPILKLLDYAPVDSVYGPRTTPRIDSTGNTSYVASYNGFMIPNFFTQDYTGTLGQATIVPTYPKSIDPVSYIVLDPQATISSNIPVLNLSLQPVYTLELTIQQPDTGSIGGKIVV